MLHVDSVVCLNKDARSKNIDSFCIIGQQVKEKTFILFQVWFLLLYKPINFNMKCLQVQVEMQSECTELVMVRQILVSGLVSCIILEYDRQTLYGTQILHQIVRSFSSSCMSFDYNWQCIDHRRVNLGQNWCYRLFFDCVHVYHTRLVSVTHV